MSHKRTIIEVARRGQPGDYTGAADVAALTTRVNRTDPGAGNFVMGNVLSVGIDGPRGVDPGVLYSANYASTQDALNAAESAVMAGVSGCVVMEGKRLTEITETLIIPRNTSLRGSGSRATVIWPHTTFPDNMPLIQLGRGVDNGDHGARLEDIQLNCRDRTGVTAVVAPSVQEPGGLFRVVVSSVRHGAVAIALSGDLIPSHFRIEDCEFFGSHLATTAPMVDLGVITNTTTIERTTIIGNEWGAGAHAGSIGIRISGAQVNATGCHFEQLDTGIEVSVGSGGRGALVGMGTSGNPTCALLVRVTDGAPVVMLSTIPNGTPTLFYDAELTETIVEDAAALQMWGNLPSRRRVTSTTAAPNMAPYGYMRNKHDVVLIDATADWRYPRLPMALGAKGQTVTIKRTNSGSNGVVVTTVDPELIDGAANKTLGSQYAFISCISDGANWFVVGSGGTVT